MIHATMGFTVGTRWTSTPTKQKDAAFRHTRTTTTTKITTATQLTHTNIKHDRTTDDIDSHGV